MNENLTGGEREICSELMLNKKQAMIGRKRRVGEVKRPMARLATVRLVALGAKTALSGGNDNNNYKIRIKIKTKNKNKTKMKMNKMRKKEKTREMLEPSNVDAMKQQEPKIQFIKQTGRLSIRYQLAIWFTLSAVIGLSSSSSEDLSSSFATLTQQLNIEGKFVEDIFP